MSKIVVTAANSPYFMSLLVNKYTNKFNFCIEVSSDRMISDNVLSKQGGS